jgi:enoyl-CoA hydratase/carnithine racemase
VGSVLYEVSDAVARITIDRPEKRNALNAEVIAGLREALARAGADDAARVVVLTGAGDKAFCAGADLGGFAADASRVEQHDRRGDLADLLEEMVRLPKPVVARVRGYALAGGFGLVCAADLAVASDDSAFGMPEVNTGLWPFIITAAVRHAMPPRKAFEWMLTGERFPAAEAERLGIVHRVVPARELDKAVDELCARLASRSPLTLRLGKESFYRSRDMGFREALDYLHGQLGVILQSEDVIEGITAWMQKRAPQWKGR